MRRLGVLGLGMALLLGWGTAVRAEPDDGGNAPAPSVKDTGAAAWHGHLFGSGPAPARRPRPAPKPDKKDKDKPPAKKETAAKPSAAVNEAASVRDREEAAYLRRIDVCLKLKEIAERSNDAELGRLADQLDERARDVYFHRISALPASHAEPDLDERLLDRHAPAADAGALPPAAPTHSVPAPDSRHAVAREEEP